MAKQDFPDQDTMDIADDILTSCLTYGKAADPVLFNRFDTDAMSGLQARLRQGGNALSHNDWGDLSLLLRSVALSLRPFPDLGQKYAPDTLYNAVDCIADYARGLGSRIVPPKKMKAGGRKYGF